MIWYIGYYILRLKDYFTHWKNKDFDTTEFDAFVDACNSMSAPARRKAYKDI